MNKNCKNNEGFVYILEVKDMDLPVCKIGMTTRNPIDRCNEINNSSTGDFIWKVAYYISVDDCKQFEFLVHSKLSPFRQKGREFFNIDAEKANNAMISILDAQNEIHRVENLMIESELLQKSINKPKSMLKRKRMNTDPKYVDLLHTFASILKVKGKTFGQTNQPLFGMSDGNKGVQWNIGIWSDTKMVQLGVNLEGSKKMGKWLITPFILSKPNIEEVKSKLTNIDNIYLSFTRDAWQGASRLIINEKYLGGREYTFSELDQSLWESILIEALSCLDESKNFVGRKKQQTITLVSNGKELIRDVSPHLQIWSTIDIKENVSMNIENKLKELIPLYNWVNDACMA